MELIKKIAGSKFCLKAFDYLKNDPGNLADSRIIKQFFISEHHDSVHIALIEKIY